MTIQIRTKIRSRIEALAELSGLSVDALVNSILEKEIEAKSNSVRETYRDHKSGESVSVSSTSPDRYGRRGHLADVIRRHAAEKVAMARERGEPEISIRAGDVHKDLGLHNRLPAVCAAIGSGLFAELADIKSGNMSGPANGANTIFRFEL